ncbi:MAG: ATP-binding protein [Candidatus Omnitrophica bacterium]|nr:ATP-binding protein [Candidatus Omnitrophota bacterium]
MEQEFDLEAEANHVTLFRRDLRALLLANQLDEKAANEVILAVNEVLTNCIRHAYRGKGGKIKVIFQDLPDQVRILVRDYGPKFDPTQKPDPELPPQKPGGLGIYLVRQLMDEVQYNAKWTGGNELQLLKYKCHEAGDKRLKHGG